MEIYEGAFDSWADVCREFDIDVVEPDEVILAVYESELYQGDADVIYRIGDRYYWASASHCSCYGLEGQWDPEEYSADLLIAALRRGEHFYYHEDADALRDAVIDRVLARSQLGHA